MRNHVNKVTINAAALHFRDTFSSCMYDGRGCMTGLNDVIRFKEHNAKANTLVSTFEDLILWDGSVSDGDEMKMRGKDG